MALFKNIAAPLLIFISLFGETREEEPILVHDYDKRHILYLMSTKDVTKAIDQYLKYYAQEKKHDFQILGEIGHILLENGSFDHSVENQLLSLYGLALSNENSSYHFLESAMKSPYPIVQAAALQLLSQRHEDFTEELIAIGLKSNYLMIRFEALSHLVARRAKNALGYMESLTNLLHPRFRPFFVEFYAMHGSVEATDMLRLMIKDPDSEVRIAAMLSAAGHGRDDLLADIRGVITHPDPVLKETAAYVLGGLRDLHSIDTLKATSKSPFPETKLAALISLFQLGDKTAKEEILSLTESGNLYAIIFSSAITESKEILEKLLYHRDDTVRLNAILALLSQRNPKVTKAVSELLTTDLTFFGYAPIVSPGRAAVYWRSVPMATCKGEDQKRNLEAISLHFFEEVLKSSLDLPEESFYKIAEKLLTGKQTKLIPLLMHLLENIGTQKAKEILIANALKNPIPLIKAYCNLALYRLGEKEEHRNAFFSWLSTQKGTKMIEFRPMMDRGARQDKNISNYELSPEEVSGLMIESFDAIAMKHDLDGLVFLLETMRDGHEQNRYALAGLLLKAIQ